MQVDVLVQQIAEHVQLVVPVDTAILEEEVAVFVEEEILVNLLIKAKIGGHGLEELAF